LNKWNDLNVKNLTGYVIKSGKKDMEEDEIFRNNLIFCSL